MVPRAMTGRSLLDALNVGALNYGKDGTVASANEQIRRWLGRDPTGSPFRTVLGAGGHLYWENNVEPLLAQQGHVWDVDIDLHGPDAVPVLMNVWRDGHETWIAAFRFRERLDYERALAESEARKREAEARADAWEGLDRLRSEFINKAAHEIATPLTPLQIQARRLRSVVTDPAAAKALDSIDANVAKLAKFVRDLQAALESQTGRDDIRPRRIDLSAHVQARAGEEEIQTSGAVQAWVDPDALDACLDRLLDNARRFGQGSPITLRVADDPPTLSVIDAGLGLTADQVAQAGQPFVQFHSDEVTSLGAGLGLYLVKDTIRAMGGELTIHSDGPGKGLEARLIFPTATQDGAEDT